MRMLTAMLAVLPLLGSVATAGAQCLSGSVEESGCEVPTALHLSSAILGGPPLIWSSSRGKLVPPPPGVVGWGMGQSVPLAEIIGLKIAPVGGLPQRLSYNDPNSFPGASDSRIVLVPVLHPRRPAHYRGEYP